MLHLRKNTYLLHPIVLLIPTQSINTSKLPVNLQLVFFQILCRFVWPVGFLSHLLLPLLSLRSSPEIK